MKMLIFDYRESEKQYFKTHKYPNYDITFYSDNLTDKTELSEEEFNETQIISIFVSSQITESVLKKFKNLRIIATRSRGYNHINVQACADRNLALLNVNGYGKRSVAQYTIAMILGLIRNISPAMCDFKNNTINFDDYIGYDLSELAIGVIGTGAIGSAVCEISNFFGMRVYAFDYKINEKIKDIVHYVPLEQLYKNSNIITLHLPYNDDNYHMISDKEFEIMPNGVYIINSARGELVDSLALYNSIKTGKVKGAALDVLECESLNMYPDDFIHLVKDSTCDCLTNAIVNQKLLCERNVIITPHIAYNTYESVNTILNETFENIKLCLMGRSQNRIV